MIPELNIRNLTKIMPELNDFINNCSNETSNCMDYYVISNKEGKFWLIPKGKGILIKTSLAIYNPGNLKGYLMRTFLPYAKYVKILNKQIKTLEFSINNSIIEKLFNRKSGNYCFSFFSGTPSPHRKVTVQIIVGYKKILGYMKITQNHEIKKLFDNEERILKFLKNNGISSIPNILYNNLINDNYYLVMNTQKKYHSKSPKRIKAEHNNFLIELFDKTKKKKKFFKSNYYQVIRNAKNEIENKNISENFKITISKAYEYINTKLANKTFCFVTAHRDFKFENCYIENNKLYVFDWEYAQFEYPPLVDLINFIFQVEFFRKNINYKKITCNIIQNNLYFNYLKKLNIVSNQNLYIHVLLYSVDIFMFYLTREKNINESSKFFKKLNSLILQILYQLEKQKME